jgi:hypothetical protein
MPPFGVPVNSLPGSRIHKYIYFFIFEEFQNNKKESRLPTKLTNPYPDVHSFMLDGGNCMEMCLLS